MKENVITMRVKDSVGQFSDMRENFSLRPQRIESFKNGLSKAIEELPYEEKIVLALGSPLSIGIGETAGTGAFAFALTGFIAELIGISPNVSGVDGRILNLDYLQADGLSNQVMQNLVENAIAQAIPEIGKATIGRSLKEIKTTKEA